jgi:hypothetical protein
MEKIGEGLQYTVYQSGDEVKKVPKSPEDMADYLSKYHEDAEEIQEGVRKAVKRREEVKKRLEGKNVPVIASFRFDSDVIFQKKVNVTGDVLENSGLEEKKELIDAYVRLVKDCWKYGIHDMSYNFTLNTGLDDKFRILQIDIGDLIFSRERVRREVSNRKWLEESASYNKHISEKLRPYYRRKMEDKLTVNAFDENWGEKL